MYFLRIFIKESDSLVQIQGFENYSLLREDRLKKIQKPKNSQQTQKLFKPQGKKRKKEKTKRNPCLSLHLIVVKLIIKCGKSFKYFIYPPYQGKMRLHGETNAI